MIIDNVRVTIPPDHQSEWPFTLGPVQQIAKEGLRFTQAVTFLVGENGSGKSTIIEAIAESYGLDVRGGHGGRRYGPAQRGIDRLAKSLSLQLTGLGAKTRLQRSRGFFLRAETALGIFEYMSDYHVPGYGEQHLRNVSHGEGFLQVLQGRFQGQGLYLMDEPEAALSFHSCLTLLDLLSEIVSDGSQVICATHSPLIAALPSAAILRLDDQSIQPTAWKDLELVRGWQRFMANPNTYVTHKRGA